MPWEIAWSAVWALAFSFCAAMTSLGSSVTAAGAMVVNGFL
jgi:hypothetical protein